MSPPTTIDREKSLRRRRRRERQAVVFGVLVAGLSVAALGSVAVFTGAIGSPFSRDFTTPAPDPASVSAAAPCPPDGTLPVAYSAIPLTVLNATKQAGLATETAAALASRGFAIIGTGNATASWTGVARIGFGQAGIAAAYTLAAQLEGAALVLDARADATIDFTVGRDFTGLLDPTLVLLDPAVALVGAANCIPLAEAVPAPAPVASPAAG